MKDTTPLQLSSHDPDQGRGPAAANASRMKFDPLEAFSIGTIIASALVMAGVVYSIW